MERQSIVIAALERELAQTEAHAELLRTRLANLGITNPGSWRQQEPDRGEKLDGHVPIIKKASRSETIADSEYQGLYFKIGRKAFVNHGEAVGYAAASNFVDADGKELAVEVKRRFQNGSSEVLCVMPATQFANKPRSVQIERTHVKTLDSARKASNWHPQIIGEEEIQYLGGAEEIIVRV
jgi:hypothetical protein